MKRTLVIRLFSANAFAVTVGNKRKPEVGATGNSSRRAEAQLERVKKETKEAFDAATDGALTGIRGLTVSPWAAAVKRFDLISSSK
jgi:hypothetical protein